jgi:nascent polypeptide-associated complex subunit alpha
MTKDDTHSDTSSLPELEDPANADPSNATINEDSEQGRNEKKARKALSKLGLKKVEGITRVVIRKPKNVGKHISKN